ncbi:hypothetical protein D1872_330170 [compost metagenome]
MGKPIIDQARRVGWGGASVVYLVHYSYDLGWLALLAGLGGLAGVAGRIILAPLMFILAAVLGYYGIKMISRVFLGKV